MKVTICDKCGSIILNTQDITKVCISAWYFPVHESAIDIIKGDAHDLCKECFSEFLKRLKDDYQFVTTGHEDDER